MSLPTEYRWLEKLNPPRILDEALQLLGLREVVGDQHNPIILSWAKELGLEAVYRADEIPWCGLFAGIVVKRAGWAPVADPLWAKNWQKFGNAAAAPSLGDVLVFTRPGGGGHVGFYIGEDAKAFHVLGGNQGDAVSITRIARARLLGARRPAWRVAQPASVKPYPLLATGSMSRNEA